MMIVNFLLVIGISAYLAFLGWVAFVMCKILISSLAECRRLDKEWDG